MKKIKRITKILLLVCVCMVGVLCISNKAQAAKVSVGQVKKLKVKSVTETSGTLYWSKVSKASGYTIYEYDRAKKKYSKKIGSTKKTSYTVKKLKVGTNHLYKVVAYRKSGKKTYKGKYSSSARLVTKSKKVTTLKKSTIRRNYIKLVWNKPSGADGYAVYKYNYSTKKYDKVGTTTSTSYTVKNLQDATKYKFVVKSYAKAVNTTSYASNSNAVETYTKPNIVTNICQTESKSTNSITFTWTKARVAAAYRIYRLNTSNNSWTFLREVSNTTTSYTDTSLVAGSTYKYMVRSIIKDENNKNLFDWDYIVRDMITIPTAVSTLAGNEGSITDTSVQIVWSAVNGASGYYVEKYDEAKKVYIRVGKTSSLNYTDKGLSGLTSYTYRVIPYKTYSVNNKEYVGGTNKTVTLKTKLGTPSNLRITNKTDNSVEVTWDKVDKATGYNVYIYENGQLIKQEQTSATSYIYTIEEAGVIGVNIKVEAYHKEPVVSPPSNVTGGGSTSAGSGTGSNGGTGNITYNIVGGSSALDVSNMVDKVKGLKRSAYSMSSLGITWDRLPNAVRYEIFLKNDTGYTKVGESTSNCYTVNGLNSGTYYTYCVRAVEMYEGRTLYGPYSDPQTYLTMNKAPTIKVSHTDTKKLKISWSELPNVTNYEVFKYNPSTGTYALLTRTSSSVRSCVDTNVAMGTKYKYKVRSYTSHNSYDYYGTFSPVITRRLGQYGIDVSKWQGTINWTNVKNAGVDFAIIRATQYSSSGANGTKLVRDSCFTANIKGAIAAGIDVGVYVYSYASSVEQARKEAELVLSYVEPYNLTYPIYFDIEDPDRASKSLKTENTNMAIAFCDKIKASGYIPGVYSGASYYTTYLNVSALNNYELWVARYVKSDVYKYPSQLSAINKYLALTYQYGGSYKSINAPMWQYTDNGRVSGISGAVDMNISYKTY